MKHKITNIRWIFALIIIAISCGEIVAASDNDSIYISGRLKEALGKTDLTEGWAVMLDSEGNPKDTVKANQGRAFING